MNSFIDALRNGFIVLGENWQLLLVILSLIFVGQFVIDRVMRSIFGDRLAGEEYFSLGMAGWLLPTLLLSMLWYGLRISIVPHLNGGMFILLLGIVAVILFFRIQKQDVQRSKTILFWLLAFVCISIPLRLAFISGLVLPLYFDSTRHYAIIHDMLGNIDLAAAMSPGLTTDYYHVGFHLLAAFMTSILDVNISQTMLVLGQIILAVAPLSVFFLIRHATRSNSAGIFAVLLAGFGWSMPAYALNWGKYPAVASLGLIPFVLSVAYLAAQRRNELTKQKQWTLYTMLASAIATCGILHSRSLVVIAIAVLAWIIAGWWQNLPKQPRIILFCALLLGILFGGFYIYRQEVLEPLFRPYISQRIFVTVMILFLSFFAHKAYPTWTFANLIAIFLLLGGLFVPTMDLLPRLADLTLLDRPFVEMVLFLPLSFLGGLGMAGLAQTLKHARTDVVLRGEYISIMFITFLIGNTILQYDFYPSDCCIIIGRDDTTAMNWIRNNIPADARILISAEELTVLPTGALQGYAPADAGGWITPLTGRVTVPILYDTNLDKDQKFDAICEMGIDYIYIGGIGRSFHAPRIRSNPHWYAAVLSLSRVEVYQVIGCR